MNPLLQKLLSRYMAPAGDDGSDTGGSGVTDRGDDFVSTEDEPAPAAKPTPSAADSDDDIDPEDPDADPEAEEETKAEKKQREQRIPLSRHKDLLEKERAKRADLERQLSQFQRGTEVASLNQDITQAEESILAMEKQYNALLGEGELDKAAALMSKIRQAERSIGDAKNDMKIAAAEARATERARYNVALERIEAAYPSLNEDHADYDEGLMEDVIDLKGAYERKGLTPTAAMQKAVDKLLGTSTKKQEAAIDTTPRVADKDVAAERKKDAVKKTLDAVGKTPPSTTKVGMDSDKAGGSLTAKDVMKLSQDDFRKLPDDVLARMRGDEL
ncbi:MULTISPECIES: hypothetical protein [unclassified Acidovorax]|uniref:hypothetical protein n=1 Tax=unclassified Acidovorax TaxID=2684926 RepID=UPI000B48DC18|nr:MULTISPECIES: hypothetical protein [unclassified Acidovorax]